MLLIPFCFGRNNQNFLCRCAIRNGTTTHSTSGQIPACSGCFGSDQFRVEMGISASTGFAFKKKIYLTITLFYISNQMFTNPYTCEASILTRSKALNS